MTSLWQDYIDFIISKGGVENVLIVSKEDGSMWASSSKEDFFLRKYKATITKEDGNEEEQVVNEAANLLSFINGSVPLQGLRINGQKKMQVTKNQIEEFTGQRVLYCKVPQGGAVVAQAGRCILIGTYNENKNHTSAQCADLIMSMAMYLAKSVWPEGCEGDGGATGGGTASADSGTSSTGWQSLVDKALVAKGNIHAAMLINSKDGSVLAATPNFNLLKYTAEIVQEDGTDKDETVDEAKNILTLMNEKRKTLQGLRVNKEKFQVVNQKLDEFCSCYAVYGKKTLGGICIYDGGKVLVLGIFDEKLNHTSHGCNEACGLLAKYFKETVV